tara:strand:- start:19034 stop:19501 length:468 start_codon:yes stop_codon:yes gene_type:complete
MDKTFEDYWNNPDIKNIMNKVCIKYRRGIDLDELESIKMVTLWKCIAKYDPSRKTKFTSFLYQHLTFACKNQLKKKKLEYSCDNIETMDHRNFNTGIGYLVEGMPEKPAKVLQQRYVDNMTMNEIGRENGYSRETARRRVISAIQLCKNLNTIRY